MFSHDIYNPNNFVTSKDYDIIPIGHRCSSAIACKFANIRKFSLPFDWNIPLFPNKIIKVLENNFDDFIPDVHKGIYKNKYGIHLAHFDRNISNGIEQYERRIKRFNFIIKTPKKKYFIYINEDFLYDVNYRRDELNASVFNELLNLEQFIKKKYTNIDYNIIYLNFKQHVIPTDSNIINIILHSSTLYDTYIDSEVAQFRIYCAKILADLFKTELKLVCEMDVFNT